MELILLEICKHAYARNLNIFNTGIYFNTYKYKPKLKPGENLNLLDEGIFKFNKGSAEKQKVYDKLVDQYFVIENDIYFRGTDLKIYFINSINREKQILDFNNLTYYNLNKQSVLTRENNINGFYKPEYIKVFFNEIDIEEFYNNGNYIKGKAGDIKYKNGFEVLKGIDDYLLFTCFSNQGNMRKEFNINESFGFEKGYFGPNKFFTDKIFSINNEYWIIYFTDNSILQLDENCKVGWFRIKDAYHTYNFHGTTLYGISDENLVAINAATGEILISKNIVAIKEKYNCPLYRGRGIWIYEDYIFLVSPKRSDEWVVFDKNTLEEVGHMYIDHKDKDEVVRIPGMFCSNFIYSKGKVYINDTADWLRVYDIEFKK